MPLRFLSYSTDTYYSWFVDMKQIHKRAIFKIPTPKFYVLYNGEEKLENDILRLSDAFKLPSKEISLEIVAKVIDVNYSSGSDILKKSESLRGYAYLLELIRTQTREGMSRDRAIKPAIDKCISEGVLVDFLKRYYEEVANMLAYEYKYEDEFAANREEGREEGRKEGHKEGQLRVALEMFNDGFTFEQIAQYVKLPVEQIKGFLSR